MTRSTGRARRAGWPVRVLVGSLIAASLMPLTVEAEAQTTAGRRGAVAPGAAAPGTAAPDAGTPASGFSAPVMPSVTLPAVTSPGPPLAPLVGAPAGFDNRTVVMPDAPALFPAPFKDDAFRQRGDTDNPDVVEETPSDTVTAAPLPPARATMNEDDQDDQGVELVPNPLGEQVPGKAAPKGPVQPPAGTPRRGSWVQMGTATLQALDKINARVALLTVKTGETGHFGSLDIAVKGCFLRPPDQPADATAFLVIKDQHSDAQPFSGWMVRSLPSMSMMASPVYDVRIAGCAP